MGKRNLKTRRNVLKVAGSIGTVGVAGCLGGGDSDNSEDTTTQGGTSEGTEDDSGSDGNGGGEIELVMGTAPQVSGQYAMFQGLASAFDQNSDRISLDVRPSQDLVSNVGKMARDEIDIGLVQNIGAKDLQEGRGAFSEIDLDMQLVSHSSTTDWFLISNSSDYTSVYDITEDTRVMPGAAGSSGASNVKQCLGLEDITFTERNVPITDIANALSSGRIDVGLAANNNAASEPVQPGWVQTIQSSIEGRILEVSADHGEAINNQSGLRSVAFEPANAEGWTQAPSPTRSFSTVVYMVTSGDTSAETVQTFVNELYNMRNDLGEYHDLLSYFENDAHWTRFAFDGYDFHAGAADAFEEHGLLE